MLRRLAAAILAAVAEAHALALVVDLARAAAAPAGAGDALGIVLQEVDVCVHNCDARGT